MANTANAASDLYRAQRAARQERRPKRAQVFDAQNKRKPELTRPNAFDSMSVAANNEQFYDHVNEKQRLKKDRDFREAQNRQRIKSMTSQRIPLTQELQEAYEQVPEEQRAETAPYLNKFREDAARARQSYGFDGRHALQSEIDRIGSEAAKEIKSRFVKKVFGGAADKGWRAFGDASPADVGEFGFFYLVAGSIVNMYRLFLTARYYSDHGISQSVIEDVKSVENPLAESQEEPKGFFKELMPQRMNLADPSVWAVDLPAAVIGFLVLGIAFALINVLLLGIGLLLMAVGLIDLGFGDIINFIL